MKKKNFIITVILFLFIAKTWSQSIIYVDSSAVAGGNGSSWATAYNDLQIALDSAQFGDSIWVATGTYKPSKKAADTNSIGEVTIDKDMAFVLKAGVSIFGGFSGVETSLNQREIGRASCREV